MLSYAGNAEDVVLARAFDAQPSGFYLDVGAGHPVLGSVTKHFYDRGWSGVNLVPSPEAHTLFCDARPRDVNLRWPPDELQAPRVPLAEICAGHAARPIDFLRIDQDGSAEETVRGGDWTRHRPRVLVVGPTQPGTSPAGLAAWEPLVLAADYRLALFDGLSRFYVRAEDAALLPHLAVPANPRDAWEPHRYVSKIDELERHAAALAAEVDKRGRYATDAQEHFNRCQAWVAVLERKVRRFEEHLGLLPDTLPPPRPQYTAEDFVRFLYALVNCTDPPGPQVAQWADRLRAGTTMPDLFNAFLATTESDPTLSIHSLRPRDRQRPPPADHDRESRTAVHPGAVRVPELGPMPMASQRAISDHDRRPSNAGP